MTLIIIYIQLLEGQIFFSFCVSCHGAWDLGSLTRDQTHTPLAGEAQSLHHWPAGSPLEQQM